MSRNRLFLGGLLSSRAPPSLHRLAPIVTLPATACKPQCPCRIKRRNLDAPGLAVETGDSHRRGRPSDTRLERNHCQGSGKGCTISAAGLFTVYVATQLQLVGVTVNTASLFAVVPIAYRWLLLSQKIWSISLVDINPV